MQPLELTEDQYYDYLCFGTFSPDRVTYGDVHLLMGPSDEEIRHRKLLNEIKRLEKIENSSTQQEHRSPVTIGKKQLFATSPRLS